MLSSSGGVITADMMAMLSAQDSHGWGLQQQIQVSIGTACERPVRLSSFTEALDAPERLQNATHLSNKAAATHESELERLRAALAEQEALTRRQSVKIKEQAGVIQELVRGNVQRV